MPTFGVERRGAPSFSFTRIDQEKINLRTQIYEPDILVILDASLLNDKDLVECVKKNGTIIFIENTQSWKQYRIDKNIWFQLGGYGGIKFEEYVSGSERINNWLKKSIQRHRGGWSLNYPVEQRPESEWGTPRGLDKNIKNYCKKNIC